MSNYNLIAGFYDPLARLVFWGRIHRANTKYLHDIESGSKILIIGGGRGKLLLDLPQNCSVDFVDPSKNMLKGARAFAKRRNDLKVAFHQQKFQKFESTEQYDFIICPFYFDQFNNWEIDRQLTKIQVMLKPNGELFVSDFFPAKNARFMFHKGVIWLMIMYFRIFTGLKINNIADIREALKNSGWERQAEEKFFSGMIFSSKWINKMH